MRRLRQLELALVLLVAAVSAFPAGGEAEPAAPRRVAFDARATYFVLDTGFFDLSNGLGADAALRCELSPNIYFESSIGFFGSEGAGVSVDGVDFGLSLVALFPVLLAYRPIARAGVGFITVDPVTVTPTSSFRPAQTSMYLVGGVGVTRSLFGDVSLEADASFWITPYRYRMYAFDRREVRVNEERFAHIAISLGAVYAF